VKWPGAPVIGHPAQEGPRYLLDLSARPDGWPRDHHQRLDGSHRQVRASCTLVTARREAAMLAQGGSPQRCSPLAALELTTLGRVP